MWEATYISSILYTCLKMIVVLFETGIKLWKKYIIQEFRYMSLREFFTSLSNNFGVKILLNRKNIVYQKG